MAREAKQCNQPLSAATDFGGGIGARTVGKTAPAN